MASEAGLYVWLKVPDDVEITEQFARTGGGGVAGPDIRPRRGGVYSPGVGTDAGRMQGSSGGGDQMSEQLLIETAYRDHSAALGDAREAVLNTIARLDAGRDPGRREDRWRLGGQRSGSSRPSCSTSG